MATKRNMVLRIQTPNGMKRIEVAATDTVMSLYDKIHIFLKLEVNGWLIYKDRAMKEVLNRNMKKTVKGLKLNHGDIIYIKETQKEKENGGNGSNENVAKDEIDVLLSHQSGLVKRKRHKQLCHHGENGQCVHCAPYEPYDEDYLKSLNPPAKHLSFHAYLKKMKSGMSKGKYISLEDINCKIKPGCKEHPPWPKGICTKCQPSAVMLNRQEYRHVDNIMFENPVIMDRFLNYWRTTGCQRLGFLYGRYEKHENVPLGIRATVAAIYEPPQLSSRDKIELQEDSDEEAVDLLASFFGLKRVGWIITDLIQDEEKSGLVRHLRHAHTHFLSAQECITAAHFQNLHPNASNDSSSGRFGSKFVTVVVSGHEDQHIHYDGWQVSNQCMALVRDDCLVPTIDDSALGYIKESSNQQFVPDVFYKEKDTYGNEVTKVGRPMPIEYFLIEVPAGFPLEPVSTFSSDTQKLFPIENRTTMGEVQDFSVLSQHVNRVSSTDSDMLMNFLDFHFLLFLMTNDIVQISKHVMGDLCKALREKDQVQFHHWLESKEWKTIETMTLAQVPSPKGASNTSVEFMETDSVQVTGWTCRHCTFINTSPTSNVCEMCRLPKV